MNICIVSPDYPTSTSIDFIFVDQLIRAMSDLGVTINVISPQSVSKSLFRKKSFTPASSINTTANGYQFYLHRPKYLSVGAGTNIQKYLNVHGFHNAVKRAYYRLSNKPDVCYGHFWQSVHALFPLAQQDNIPLFASSGEEEVLFHKQIGLEEKMKLANYLSGVISVSTKNKNECISAGLAIEQNIMVIPNAVDSELFFQRDKQDCRKKMGYQQDYFIVAFVGQFDSRKGVERLNQALEELNDNSIKALFMGAGPDKPEYSGTLISQTVPHDMLPEYLSCADVFVLPTLNEGCSNAIIEAMACGLPIISSDLPFNHDILNKSNAILIDPTNTSQISQAILALKNNPDKRMQLSKQVISTASRLKLTNRAENIIEFIRSRIHQVS